MNSMTGFGTAAVHDASGSVTVSIKSVNHKGLDIRIRGLEETPEAEMLVKEILRHHLKRGQVELKCTRARGEEEAALFSPEMFDAYAALLRKTGAVKEGENPDPYWILSRPGVVRTAAAEEDAFPLAALKEAVERAVEALCAMRAAEGENLRVRTEAYAADLRRFVQAMERESAAEKSLRRAEFENRVRTFMAEFEADPARLATEIALLYDKMSVEEEIVRLYSHLDQFDDIIKGNGPVGRKLDFLLQEMHREANTISSKSKSVAVLHDIVEVKSLIEDMREQIANIE